MANVICAFVLGDGFKGGFESDAEGFGASGCGTAQPGLDLGEYHFDGVEVGAGGQEVQFGPTNLNGCTGAGFGDIFPRLLCRARCPETFFSAVALAATVLFWL